jgi:hypothetical protein
VESTSDAAAVHVADFLEMSSSHKRLTNEELEKELKRHSQSGTKCLIIRRYGSFFVARFKRLFTRRHYILCLQYRDLVERVLSFVTELL